jgi:non-canonical (house-cleaning) NTP pyrophosphatase
MNEVTGEIVVAIGSKNPVKIESTKLAFERIYPGAVVIIHGFNVGHVI